MGGVGVGDVCQAEHQPGELPNMRHHPCARPVLPVRRGDTLVTLAPSEPGLHLHLDDGHPQHGGALHRAAVRPAGQQQEVGAAPEPLATLPTPRECESRGAARTVTELTFLFEESAAAKCGVERKEEVDQCCSLVLRSVVV